MNFSVKQISPAGEFSSWPIFETVAGSHSYNLNVSTSDEDIRGIFKLPAYFYLGLDLPPDQISDEKSDVVFYSMKRFFQLATDCNPNIIELLWMPKHCVKRIQPTMHELMQNRDLFISKKCFYTFSGYAYAQIKRAKGQNKWVNNPQPVEPPNREDFIWVMDKTSNRPKHISNCPEYKEIIFNGKKSSVEHVPNMYRVYSSKCTSGLFNNGRINCESVSLEEEQTFFGFLIYNEIEFDKAKKDHTNYWDWVKNRNKNRWISQENGEVDYDCKNIMHCMRLIYSCENILNNGEPIVYFSDDSEEREFLMNIRNGNYSFDDLMEIVEDKMKTLDKLKEKSDIPDKVSTKRINNLYSELG